MAQLTIEIPDALLTELEPFRSELPSLLNQWAIASRVSSVNIHQTAAQEVLNFLMTQPTPQDIFNLTHTNTENSCLFHCEPKKYGLDYGV